MSFSKLHSVIHIFKPEAWQLHLYIVIYIFPVFMLNSYILQPKYKNKESPIWSRKMFQVLGARPVETEIHI